MGCGTSSPGGVGKEVAWVTDVPVATHSLSCVEESSSLLHRRPGASKRTPPKHLLDRRQCAFECEPAPPPGNRPHLLQQGTLHPPASRQCSCAVRACPSSFSREPCTLLRVLSLQHTATCVRAWGSAQHGGRLPDGVPAAPWAPACTHTHTHVHTHTHARLRVHTHAQITQGRLVMEAAEHQHPGSRSPSGQWPTPHLSGAARPAVALAPTCRCRRWWGFG